MDYPSSTMCRRTSGPKKQYWTQLRRQLSALSQSHEGASIQQLFSPLHMELAVCMLTLDPRSLLE